MPFSLDQIDHDEPTRSFPFFLKLCILALLILSLYGIFDFLKALYLNRDILSDFKVIYLASAAWAHGLNPYNHDLFASLWAQGGGKLAHLPNFKSLPSLYPLTTYVILGPLGLLNWRQAEILWSLINLLAIIPLYVSLLNLARLRSTEWRGILLLAFSLVLYPLQHSLRLGQPTILAASLLVVSLALSTPRSSRNYLSGILLGLSLSLKPQISLLFLLYFTFCRRWSLAVSCLTVCLAIFLLGVFRLGFQDFSYLISWKANIESAFTTKGINNPDIFSNNLAIYLINLKYLLYNLMNAYMANLLLYIILACEIIIFLKFMSVDDIFDDLLNFSIISLITLLAFYHKVQDAIILTIPLSLLITLIGTQYDKFAKLSLILITAFIIPKQLFIQNIFHYYVTHSFSMKFTQSIIFFILAYRSIVIFLLSVLFLYLLTIKCARGGPKYNRGSFGSQIQP